MNCGERGRALAAWPRGGVGALAALLSSSLLAVAGAGVVWHRARPAGSPDAERLAWSEAAGGARLAGGRLWQVAWSQKELDQIPDSAEIRARVRQMIKDAAHDCSARCLTNLALVKLMQSRTAVAVEILERAAAWAPADAVPWSDLAVARLALAEKSGNAVALVEALEANDKALSIAPHLEEALFNRALILQRLHLVTVTRDALARYLTTDSGSAWADEARRLLAAIPTGSERLRWQIELARLAATGANPQNARGAVEASRQEARVQAEEKTLAAWGDGWLRGRRDEALRQLRMAEEVGGALVAVGSDPMIADAAATIRGAEARGDLAALAALAGGHRAYAEGMELYKAAADRQALQRFDDAARLLGRAGSPFAAWALFRVQICHYYDGENTTVLMALRQLLSEPTARRYSALRGRLSLLAGMASLRMARLSDGQRFYRQALAAFAGIAETEHIAASYFMLGEAQQMAGDLEAAWDQRLAAVALANRLGASIYYYLSLYDAAQACEQAGQQDLALVFETEMASFARAKGDALLLTETLVARARTRFRLGDAPGARRDLAAAGSWLRDVPPGERQLRLQTSVKLAAAEMLAAGPAALDTVTAAIAMARSRRDDFRLPQLVELRARIELAAGRLTPAEADLLAGIDECERQRERLLTEQLPGAFLDQHQGVFEAMVRLQLRQGQPERAFEFAERGRTRNLLETLLSEPSQGGAHIAEGVASAAAIARALPPRTTLIEFAVGADRTVAWTVSHDGLSVHELPVGELELGRRVRELRRQVEHEAEVLPREGSALFEILFGPLAASIESADALVIVPDESLQMLPFAALWDRRGPRFLIERWAISTSPSATLYLHSLYHDAELSHGLPANVLVVTAPILTGTEYANLPSLPAAGVEARQVAAAYPHATVLVGADASQQAVRAAAAHHEVVHFATHAVLNPHYPLLSAIPLSPASGDDRGGALYAQDIYQLRLTRTRLVVLAACDTGNGRLSRSEGVDSLGRAFLAAGVPAVVDSLWPVDDDPAARFFADFHRRVGAGDDPASALRAVQLALLKATTGTLRLPRAWAAYQLIGGVAAGSAH